MKRAIPILAILLTAHYAQAQVAAKLSIADTRDANTLPSGYSQEARFEFKARAAVGVPGEGEYSGLLTIAPWAPDNTGNKFHQLNFNDGGIYYRTAPSYNTPWEAWRKLAIEDANGNLGIGVNSPNSMLHIKTPNYTTKGIIIESDNAKLEYGNHAITLSSKPTWSNVPYIEWNNPQGLRQAYLGWDPSVFNLTLENGYNFSINGGNVLIGKPTQVNPAYKLNVAGKVRADEITVNTSGADFVFENGYNLRPLTEVESFLKANKHLPDVAPASEMQNNGVSVGEMNAKLLQKVEELTLYLIEKDKKIKELEGRCSDYDSLKARVEKIENALSNK